MHGIDAFSIHCETPSSSFATLKVAVLEQVDTGAPADMDGLCEFVKSQTLHLGQG